MEVLKLIIDNPVEIFVVLIGVAVLIDAIKEKKC